MEVMIAVATFGALIGYAIVLGTGRPILVAFLLGMLPSIAIMQLPPFIGLGFLPWGPGVIIGCFGAWAYRKLKARTH